MAIDTAAKRLSALLDPDMLPLPDGTISASDRLTLVGFYSGIAALIGPGSLAAEALTLTLVSGEAISFTSANVSALTFASIANDTVRLN